jgi:hypothetical protein
MATHLDKLKQARDRAVAATREMAAASGHTEEMRELFMSIQNTIEAIDRATRDEERISERAVKREAEERLGALKRN